MKILITDGNQRSALAAVRSLGRKGMRVVVGDSSRKSLASASKYCIEYVCYPSPVENPGKFSRYVTEFVKAGNIDMVIPMSDITTYILSKNQAIKRYTCLPLPTHKSFDFVSNKSSLVKFAHEMGVPIPNTVVIDKDCSLNSVIDDLRYPIVVKPSRSRYETENGWLFSRVLYANSRNELLNLYKEKEYLRYPFLLQERVNGPGLGIFGLWKNGELVADFGHRRLRERPPSGGVSVLRESIAVDTQLREYAIKLLKPLEWHGVAMVEFKLNLETCEAVLMEVNGRFWGSLQLAIDAGVNFPYLLSKLADKESVVERPEQILGIKSRWLLGDIDHLILRLFKSESKLNLPNNFPGKWKTLCEFLKFYQPSMNYEIISISDIKPFVYELGAYIKNCILRK